MDVEYNDPAISDLEIKDSDAGTAQHDEQTEEKHQLQPMQDSQNVMEDATGGKDGPGHAPTSSGTLHHAATDVKKTKRETIAESRAAAEAALKSHKSINAETTDISRC